METTLERMRRFDWLIYGMTEKFLALGEKFSRKELEEGTWRTQKIEKTSCLKVKQSVGVILEKIISNYEIVYDGPVDEEALLSKCRLAISKVDKVDNEIGNGRVNGSELVELQGQYSILRDCTEQLRAAEASRLTLVSHLKEALQEQESKLEVVRGRLQAALSHSERVGNICQQLVTFKSGQLPEHKLNEPSTPKDMSSSFVQEPTRDGHAKEQSAPVVYAQQESPNTCSHIEDNPHKSAAAAVAAKLSASTSSVQMLTYVLSSLASEGVIGNRSIESSREYPSEKRPKLENGSNSCSPSPQHQPPLPHFPHPDSVQSKITTTQAAASHQPPSSPSMSHPSQPVLQPPSMNYTRTTGTTTAGAYNHGLAKDPPTFTSYPIVGGIQQKGVHLNPYQGYHGHDGSFSSQSSIQVSSPPMPQQ